MGRCEAELTRGGDFRGRVSGKEGKDLPGSGGAGEDPRTRNMKYIPAGKEKHKSATPRENLWN